MFPYKCKFKLFFFSFKFAAGRAISKLFPRIRRIEHDERIDMDISLIFSSFEIVSYESSSAYKAMATSNKVCVADASKLTLLKQYSQLGCVDECAFQKTVSDLQCQYEEYQQMAKYINVTTGFEDLSVCGKEEMEAFLGNSEGILKECDQCLKPCDFLEFKTYTR